MEQLPCNGSWRRDGTGEVWAEERRDGADASRDEDSGLRELYLGPNPVACGDAARRSNPLSPFAAGNRRPGSTSRTGWRRQRQALHHDRILPPAQPPTLSQPATLDSQLLDCSWQWQCNGAGGREPGRRAMGFVRRTQSKEKAPRWRAQMAPKAGAAGRNGVPALGRKLALVPGFGLVYPSLGCGAGRTGPALQERSTTQKSVKARSRARANR
jgi:hypothetical protein